jgi:hypothetical protein
MKGGRADSPKLPLGVSFYLLLKKFWGVTKKAGGHGPENAHWRDYGLYRNGSN